MSTTNRDRLEAWAEDWANNDIPEHAMDLFLDAAEKALDANPAVASESLGDYSVSTREQALRVAASEYLLPYKKVKW